MVPTDATATEPIDELTKEAGGSGNGRVEGSGDQVDDGSSSKADHISNLKGSDIISLLFKQY